MKKLCLSLASFLLAFVNLHATHVVGGEIRMTHISGFQYKIELSIYRDMSGIPVPATATVEAYRRISPVSVHNWSLTRDSISIVPPQTLGCGSPILTVEQHHFSGIFTLDTNVFNHPAGYYLVSQTCCRNGGVVNLLNSSGQGWTIVTMIPPIISNGQPLVNSSPVLSSPMSDFAIQGHPYYMDFGGTDPDGDSLSYVLYSPFDDGALTSGSVTSVSTPYPDPTTHIAPIQWANCYNESNQINGASNSTCTSSNEPDRLKIDPATGELTMIPGSPPGYYVYGIWCREYRNGQLIGSVFRDFQISITNNQLDPNNAPQVHVPQLQALANWDADTMIFTGSPVCVQLGVTDPDSIADIEIEAVYSDYDPGDLAFLQNYGVILNPDTFQTALCFQPDSFLPYTTRGDVVALNPGCFDLRGDTLPFYFKFVGYSNAGWGGIVDLQIGTSQLIPLFSLLNHNPNPGGSWYDLDNSGLLNANNEFVANNVTSPASYRFMYIDQQPNYPPDTALLTLNFVMPSGLENSLDNDVSIYPNPSNGNMTIEVQENLIGAEAEVYSYDLKRIQSFRIEKQRSNIQIEKPGLYFIRIEGQSGMQKVIIEN
jgi:hypothetical protein